MRKIGIYPGTFDPITNGHIDLIKRSLKMVETKIISKCQACTERPCGSGNCQIRALIKRIDPKILYD